MKRRYILVTIQEFWASEQTLKSNRVTSFPLSHSSPFKAVCSRFSEHHSASLYVKDKLCLILSQVQGRSTPGGRYTHKQICASTKTKHLVTASECFYTQPGPLSLTNAERQVSRQRRCACEDSAESKRYEIFREKQYFSLAFSESFLWVQAEGLWTYSVLLYWRSKSVMGVLCWIFTSGKQHIIFLHYYTAVYYQLTNTKSNSNIAVLYKHTSNQVCKYWQCHNIL